MNDVPSSRGRWWPRSLAGKAFVIGLAMALTLAVAWGVAVKVASDRLAAAFKAVEVRSRPLDLQALYGPFVPLEKNAAVPMADAATAATQFMAKENAARKDQEPQLIYDDPAFHKAALAFVSDAKFEALLVDAERRPGYHSLNVPPDLSLAPLPVHMNAFRDLARVETGVTRSLLSEGKAEEACRRWLRMSRLLRKWESGEPQVIAMFINLATRGLMFNELNRILRSAGPLNPTMHTEIEAEIAKHDDVLVQIPSVVSMQMLIYIANHDRNSPLGMTPFARPFADNEKAYVLRTYLRMAAAAELPHFKARPELDAIEDDLLAKRKDHLGVMFFPCSFMLANHSQIYRESFDRVVAMSRCLRIVNAWARRGDFNLDLDKLGLPAECLVDPFDGRRLRVKRTPRGPIVYTVYWNQQDDDGDMSIGADFSLAPIKSPESK